MMMKIVKRINDHGSKGWTFYCAYWMCLLVDSPTYSGREGMEDKDDFRNL